jgi:hypothetical protein
VAARRRSSSSSTSSLPAPAAPLANTL